MLLAHGAPVKVKNKLGWTPLAEAIRSGIFQIVIVSAIFFCCNTNFPPKKTRPQIKFTKYSFVTMQISRQKIKLPKISCFRSYGDRQTISNLLRKLKSQSKEQLKARKPAMIEALKNLGDYVVELKWDFTSWLPLVSKMLPSDICKISKKGRT